MTRAQTSRSDRGREKPDEHAGEAKIENDEATKRLLCELTLEPERYRPHPPIFISVSPLLAGDFSYDGPFNPVLAAPRSPVTQRHDITYGLCCQASWFARGQTNMLTSEGCDRFSLAGFLAANTAAGRTDYRKDIGISAPVLRRSLRLKCSVIKFHYPRRGVQHASVMRDHYERAIAAELVHE